MGLAMSDGKITLDLGLGLDGDGDSANKDQNGANQSGGIGELTLDLSSTVAGDDEKVVHGSGDTAPEALAVVLAHLT